MGLYTRTGLALLGVAGAAALFFTLRYQMVQGAFETINPVAPGPCRIIGKGLNGPEDMEIDAAHNAIIASTGGTSPHRTPRDGIYWLKLNDLAAPPLKLAGTPADIHSHGINLYRAADGSETLLVINHPLKGRQEVEVYGLSYDGPTPKLTLQSTIKGPLMTSPNDLSASGPNRFYVAIDHAAKGTLSAFAEDYMLWSHAYIALYDGNKGRVVARGIAYPNGVQVSPDGRFVYVDAFNERRVIAYSVEPSSGDLTEIGSLSLPAKLDNISMDAGGNLIIAGRTKPASSQVFRVHLGQDGVPRSYETLFSDDGHIITRASSGVVWNGHLFIGSSRDDHILMCDLKS